MASYGYKVKTVFRGNPEKEDKYHILRDTLMDSDFDDAPRPAPRMRFPNIERRERLERERLRAQRAQEIRSPNAVINKLDRNSKERMLKKLNKE